ncbi:unnamed protein product [Amoebophrya sp. A25]|nr:unnamed protein product [Amoebophrya sp. A25]|eukprot:GSA25T00021481001.1
MRVESARYPFLFFEDLDDSENFYYAVSRYLLLPDDSPLLDVRGSFNKKLRKMLRLEQVSIEYVRELLLLFRRTIQRTTNRSESTHTITSRAAHKRGNPALPENIDVDYGAEILTRSV